MKVFLVIDDIPYEGMEIMGVFSTRKFAQEFMDNVPGWDTFEKQYWSVVEYQVDSEMSALA